MNTFVSCTGRELDARQWLPQGQPRAVIQLVHGMAEHIDRYDGAARALAQAGFAVVGHTHLGHGPKAELHGWFAEKDGWQCLIDDVHRLRMATQQQFPGVPYFILGHSMGSFVTRCYIMQHGGGLAGVMLSGTGFFAKPVALAGQAVANLVCLFGGEKKPSKLIDRIAFGSGGKDWLTRDAAVVEDYLADPHCGFVFTGGAYRDFLTGLNSLSRIHDVPADLPIYFFSGDADPVGKGDGVNKSAQQLRQAGVRQVEVKLYHQGRHEMLNEINREEVYQDVIAWVEKHI